ncbi:MAG TPA: alcohol dehydrogenase catalytic domain-containing protein [Acidimicrobiales bacterium]|nr:alcohol dehydrogenase catalytic domain-containing protein [Acidimicrobiales bacterium]
MKALRLRSAGNIELVDEPSPQPETGEALVRVLSVGICGSDLHWFMQGNIGDAVLHQPLVLGHEFGGVVEGGPLDGRRVAVDPAVPCGACARCREGNENLCPTVRFAGHSGTDGGLREYIAWPTKLLHPVPDGFDDSTIALLEPLGVALHALDLGHVRFGAPVGVVGCGPIGLMLVQLAHAGGGSSVIAVERLVHRRHAATALGCEVAVGPGDVGSCENTVDVVFEVAGNDEAIVAAMTIVRPGGRVVLAGIPDDDMTRFPASLARRKGLTIAIVRRMKDAYPRAIRLVERKVVDLEPLASHTWPLEDAAEAFTSAARREGIKTVIAVSA